MQYQGTTINAEYISDKNQPNIQPQPYYNQPYQGQSVIGQPVQQQQGQPYPMYQPMNQFQGQYYPQQVVYSGQPQYQQVIMVPNRAMVVVAQPMNPLVAKEMSLRAYSKYFYGCNCCFGILALIFLIIRCVSLFQLGGATIAAGVMYIISDFCFVCGAICGVYSISRFIERLLAHYQILIGLALIFELVGSIIAFATYDEEEADYKEEHHDNSRSVSIIFFVITLIILFLAYGMFIRYARQIKFLMNDLTQTRITQQQQQQDQQIGPIQQQGFPQGRGILVG